MAEMKNQKGLSKSLKRFFGVGDFGFGLMSNIDTFYASYFFTNIAKFSLSAVTVMTTISAVVDAVLSCLYGPLLNRIKPRKWGRYRSWLILTPWLVPFLYAMQFVKISNGIAGAIFITMAMITSRIAWNIPFVANISMINIVGKTQKERMALSSTRMVWTSLATVVYSYVGPAAVAAFAGFLGETNAYAATAFSFAALMAAGYYAHFRMTKGYEETGEEELKRIAEETARTKQQKQKKVSALAAIGCNPHLIFLFASNITKYIVLFLVNGLAIYYFEYVSKDKGLLTGFLFAANLLGIGASYCSRFIVAKFSAKRTVILGYLVMGVSGISAFLVYKNTMVVMVLMCILLFSMNMTNSCDPELYAKCAAYSGSKLGYDVTGIVMGLLTVPIKVGIIMRGILISTCLSLAHFDVGVDPLASTEEMQRGISIGFMILPALVILAGAAILGFGYRLKQED